MAITRSPILISGCAAPHVPTRRNVCTPSSASSSTPIATDGPPIPVDIVDTGTPSTVPVNVRYSRLNATSLAPSRCLATIGVRNGSPGTSTYSPTSPLASPTWYFFSSATAIGPSVYPGHDMRRAGDFAVAHAPGGDEPRRDARHQVRRPCVDGDQRVARLHPSTHRRLDHQAGRGVHRVLLAMAARAEVKRRKADGEGV